MHYELSQRSVQEITVADVHIVPESKITIPASSPLFEVVLRMIKAYPEKAE